VTRIDERGGRTIAMFDSQPERTIEQPLAEKLVDLSGAYRRAAPAPWCAPSRGARRHRLARPARRRTTRRLVPADAAELGAGAWVGFNDPRVTIRSTTGGRADTTRCASSATSTARAEGEADRPFRRASRTCRRSVEFDRIEPIPLGSGWIIARLAIESVATRRRTRQCRGCRNLATGAELSASTRGDRTEFSRSAAHEQRLGASFVVRALWIFARRVTARRHTLPLARCPSAIARRASAGRRGQAEVVGDAQVARSVG